MNYIPGFSNYLQAAVPRYARGGRVMDGERMMYDEPMMYDGYDMGGYNEPYQYTPPLEQYMPVGQPMMYDMGGYNELPYGGGGMLAEPVEQPYQQAAVEPMTTEAVPAEVPFDPNTFDFSKLDFSGLNLGGLDSLYGMNFASNFGGGPMGGIYQADPNLQYIGAPLSNKGNATSQTGGNTFAVRADQPVRLVDHRTNQIVFEGTGFDAARKATELGQGLTNQFGRKANYSIQTADPTGNYSTVAYEKKNKSTLGQIANVAGTVLPMAAMFIPGLQGLGAVAAGAGLGGAGAALRGDDILKGIAMGGLTSAGGALLAKPLGAAANLTSGTARALGTGIGATAGGLATGQNLENSLLGGVLSGGLSYVAPDIQRGLGIGQGAAPSTGGSAVSDPSVMANVIGSNIVSPSVSVGGAKAPAPAKLAELEPPATIVSGSGSPFAAAFPIPANFLSGALPATAQPAPEPVAEQMPEEDIIKVTGQLPGDVAPSVDLDSGLSPEVLRAVTAPQPVPAAEIPAEDIIKVTGQLPGDVAPSVDLGAGLSPQVIDRVIQPSAETVSPEEILVEARKSFTPVSVTSPIATDFMPESVLPKPTVDVTDTVSPEEILVEARKLITPNVPVGGALSPEVIRAIEGPQDQIVVTGNRPGAVPAVTIPGVDTPMPDIAPPAEAEVDAKKKLGVKDYIDIATLLMGLIPCASGGGGGGSRGTIPAGLGTLSPLFSKQLPPPTLPGGVGGGALPASTLAAQGLRSPQDYYRYGYGPEQSFFSYATQGAPNTSRAYTGYEGSTAEDLFAPQPSRLPQPITTPIPEEPRGPSMYAPEVDDVRFARGGFAVEGAGDGRDDKIPALLSDGEYVIDAETVALLGNGSNKAGAKLLDSFRVKVRKQKGKKLARGKFSDNAKRPEHYLAGGKS